MWVYAFACRADYCELTHAFGNMHSFCNLWKIVLCGSSSDYLEMSTKTSSNRNSIIYFPDHVKKIICSLVFNSKYYSVVVRLPKLYMSSHYFTWGDQIIERDLFLT